MQLQAEPKGWTDADIDHVLDSLDDLTANTQSMVDDLSTLVVLVVVVALFLIAQFAWHAVGTFMPSSKGISADV